MRSDPSRGIVTGMSDNRFLTAAAYARRESCQHASTWWLAALGAGVAGLLFYAFNMKPSLPDWIESSVLLENSALIFFCVVSGVALLLLVNFVKYLVFIGPFKDYGGFVEYLRQKLGEQMWPIMIMAASSFLLLTLFWGGVIWVASNYNHRMWRIESYSLVGINMARISAIEKDILALTTPSENLAKCMDAYAERIGSNSTGYIPQRAMANIVNYQNQINNILKTYFQTPIDFDDISQFDTNKPVEGEEKFSDARLQYEYRISIYKSKSAKQKVTDRINQIKATQSALKSEIIEIGRKAQ